MILDAPVQAVSYVTPESMPSRPTVEAGLFRSWTTSPLSNLTSDTIILASNPKDKRAARECYEPLLELAAERLG